MIQSKVMSDFVHDHRQGFGQLVVVPTIASSNLRFRDVSVGLRENKHNVIGGIVQVGHSRNKVGGHNLGFGNHGADIGTSGVNTDIHNALITITGRNEGQRSGGTQVHLVG